MCNAAIKSICAAMLLASLASCGGNEDKEQANALLQQITALLDQGRPEQALEMIDTLNTRYPEQVEARRQALALRPRAMESITLAQISVADSLIADAQAQIAEIEPLLKHIPSTSGLEGYYVYGAAYNPKFIETNGLEARINDADYNFYIVAQDNAKIGLNQVALFNTVQQSESQVIPSTSSRAFTEEGWELASFLPEEVNELGQWAAGQTDIKGALLLGSKGNKKVALTPPQAASFGIAWRYGTQKQKLRSALILREKLERQLQTARDQSVNQLQ